MPPSRDTNGDGTLDERLYGLQDANWNVVALINTSATAQERYLYTPFGAPTFLNGTMSTASQTSTIDSSVLFTGQRLDDTSNLNLFRIRWFDSVTGGFLRRDPLAYPDGPNAYAAWFVPNTADPTGQAKAPCLISLYIGHNGEVGKRFMSDYLQDDGSPNCRTCVGGICCGMYNDTESEGDDSFQDYVARYFPDNVISDFPDIDDTLLFVDLGDAVYDSWQVALKQRDAMCKRKPPECQCSEVKVKVWCSRTARSCLEKKECRDSSGKVQRINLNAMDANKRKRWQAVDNICDRTRSWKCNDSGK